MASSISFTPHELLTRAPLGAFSRAEIPGKEFRGKIGTVTKTGASTGLIRVYGYPIDAYPVVLRVKTGGNLDAAELEISINGGTDFDDAVLMDVNAFAQNDPTPQRWQYEIGITGILLDARNGAASPSFILDDTWTFTTTASPKLEQICRVISAYWFKWAENTAQNITDADEADRNMMAEYGRWMLVAGRGNVPPDWKEMADNARKHFKLESLGDLQLNSAPDGGDDFVFPDYERARPPFKFTAHPGACAPPVWRH
jgi:hypothetical protein